MFPVEDFSYFINSFIMFDITQNPQDKLAIYSTVLTFHMHYINSFCLVAKCFNNYAVSLLICRMK